MTIPAVEERADRLEEAIDRFIASVGVELNKLYNPQIRTEAELRELKKENRRDKREMNRKWGDLANKLGTMVEDLVDPSLPRIVKDVLGGEVVELSIRHKRRGPDGRVKEFDAIAVTNDVVCLNSAKAALRSADVDAFITEIATFREYFPQ